MITYSLKYRVRLRKKYLPFNERRPLVLVLLGAAEERHIKESEGRVRLRASACSVM